MRRDFENRSPGLCVIRPKAISSKASIPEALTPKLTLLSLALATALTGCSSAPQTIGELIDRSGQNPDRLGMRRSDPTEANSETAIHHYEKILEIHSAPETRAEALRRAADLRIKAVDSGDAGEQDLQRAISLYLQLLNEFPRYPSNDHVLYQLARAQQLAGDDEASIDSLRLLAQRYPGSNRAADASFRAAEMLFIRKRFREAAEQYQQVSAYGTDSPYFDMSQYKYGWTQYQQADYETAIPAFLTLLDRLMPRFTNGSIAGESVTSDSAESLIAQVEPERKEMVRDAIRALCLSFAAIDGGKSIGQYFSGNTAATSKEPVYAIALYTSLGTHLLEKRRYSDAANVYEVFVETHTDHPLAPGFSSRVIKAYDAGSFSVPALHARENFAQRYSPTSTYWGGKDAPESIIQDVRRYMDEIARQYHADAQQLRADSDRNARFALAAQWYQRILSDFPNDPKRPEINQRLADALFDGGKTQQAAEQYTITAYNYADYAGAADAALAAVKSWRRLGKEVPPDQAHAVLQQTIDSSRRFANAFPNHPEKVPVLLGAAEDLYGLARYEEALEASNALSSDSQAITPLLRIKAMSISADSLFALKRFPQAETEYMQLLPQLNQDDELRTLVVERLAVSIYRQAELARSTGENRAAAALFLRASHVDVNSELAANARYDAASALVELEDWHNVGLTLEEFHRRYQNHPLAADADKLLATAYERDSRPGLAAIVFGRIAERSTESPEIRRSASQKSAQLYDQAGLVSQAAAAYEQHLRRFPHPMLAALQTRQRLAEIAASQNQIERHQQWLKEIVSAEQAAGSERNSASRSIAAQASLSLAIDSVAKANRLRLGQPIARTLAARKSAMEKAIANLNHAAAYGVAEVTTAATQELGALYRDFAEALMNTPAPNLQGDAAEQYQIMLEEQAYPFEEKAIAAFEANLQRLKQGLWNAGIEDSVAALADMVPARYAKLGKVENSYDSLD